MEPQPLSITAKGGQIIDSKTLQKLIDLILKTETCLVWIDDFLFDVKVTYLLQCALGIVIESPQ